MHFVKKFSWPILAVIVIIPLFILIIFQLNFEQPQIKWGVTFSQHYAQDELNLDWQEVYLAILDDLKINYLRLSAYWDYHQPEINRYDFTDLDWQIEEATERGIKIILAVGRRLPRWPECHDPIWLQDLTDEEIQIHQLKFIRKVVERYDNYPNIIIWQVENEPFFKFFGLCPPLDRNFFDQELALVRSISNKPIMITDSGELSTWIPAARRDNDILGTTLYRVVYSPTFGYWRYHLVPPAFYYFKAEFIKKLFPATKKIIISELQAEAWHPEDKNLSQMSREELFQSMSPKQFKENIIFAQRAGFDEIYLWGVEWWYYMKTQDNFDYYWETAKKLWRP